MNAARSQFPKLSLIHINITNGPAKPLPPRTKLSSTHPNFINVSDHLLTWAYRMPYNAEFEARIEVYRRQRRLLVARNIHFRATPEAFMNACRAKLSRPQSVTFFWRAPDRPYNTHNGWCMLAFELRDDRRQAEEDLENFEIRGRQVTVQRASRQAVSDSLLQLRMHDG
jgi:hypothetical protein